MCEEEFWNPEPYFHWHPITPDNLQPTCKECQKETKRRNRAFNTDPAARWGLQGRKLERLVEQQIQHIQELKI